MQQASAMDHINSELKRMLYEKSDDGLSPCTPRTARVTFRQGMHTAEIEHASGGPG